MDSTEANGAGSTGLKAQEGEDSQSTSSIGELAEKLLNAGKSDKDKKEIQKGDSALDTIAGKMRPWVRTSAPQRAALPRRRMSP